MPRLTLVLCLLALAGAGVLANAYVSTRKANLSLARQLADTSARAATAEAGLAAAREEAGQLKSRMAEIEIDAKRAETRAAAAESRERESAQALAQAKQALAIYEENARALGAEIATLRHDLADARASNASPQAVAGYHQTITDLERQLAELRNGAAAPAIAGAADGVFTSRAGRATVLTVGPENAFVVVNFGSARGAQAGQKMTLSRGTDALATALITDVRTNFSIAHVLPDSLRGVLHKGDAALLIR